MEVSDMEKYIKRFQKAQLIPFDLKSILDLKCFELIISHSEAIGCSPELIYFPLLTACACCMTPNTKVEVTSDWYEKLTLAILVAARRGEKKTTALNKLKSAVRNVEHELMALRKVASTDSKPSVCNKNLLLDEMALTCNTSISDISENYGGSMLVLLDDFGRFLKSSSSRLLEDAGGLSFLGRLYEGQADVMSQSDFQPSLTDTYVNFGAMIQACDIVTACEGSDEAGLLDRTLIVCAPDSTSVTIPTSRHSAALHSVLSAVRNSHQVQDVTYTFSQNGKTELERCMQSLHYIKTSTNNERLRGSINKAIGQVVRLSAVMVAMANGVTMATQAGMSQFIPSRVINSDTVSAAFFLVKNVLRQKSVLFCAESPLLLDDHADSVAHSTLPSGRTSASITASDEFTRSQTPMLPQLQRMRNDVVELSDAEDNVESTINVIQPEINTSVAYVQSLFGNSSRTRKQHIRKTPYPTPVYSQSMALPSSSSSVLSGIGVDYPQNSVPHRSEASQAPTLSSMLNTSMNSFQTAHASLDEQQLQVQQSHDQTSPQPQHIFVNRAHSTQRENHRIPNAAHSSAHVRSRDTGRFMTKMNYRSPTMSEQLMSDLYSLPDDEFLRVSWPKIKKLLLTKGISVTAAFACQYRLFPPIPKSQRQRAQMKTSHPVWAATRFFERLEALGLGNVVKPRGQNLSIRFKKKRMEEMSDLGKSVLRKINLSEEDYERSYPQLTAESSEPAATFDITPDGTAYLVEPGMNVQTYSYTMHMEQE